LPGAQPLPELPEALKVVAKWFGEVVDLIKGQTEYPRDPRDGA
jgi:hypothetical protein